MTVDTVPLALPDKTIAYCALQASKGHATEVDHAFLVVDGRQ